MFVSVFLIVNFLPGFRKRGQTRAHLSTPASQAHTPSIVVILSRLHLHQDRVYPFPKLTTLLSLHQLQQDPVTVFITKQLQDLTVGHTSQRKEDPAISPIDRDAFEQDAGRIFGQGIVREMRDDAFSDTWTLIEIEEFIAELDNIVSIAIHNQLVNVEGYIKDELSPDQVNSLVINSLLAFKLPQTTHHVLDHTHAILIQGESHEIRSDVVEISNGVLQREGFYYFLNEMRSVAVTGKIVEILCDLHRDQRVFFAKSKAI